MLKGVNYDPNHSFEFAKAVGMDDAEQMKKAIKNDFDRLYQFHKQYPEFKGINHVKTFLPFYTSSGTHKAAVTVDIAEVVSDWNQKHLDDPLYLAIGMWERGESPIDRRLEVDAIITDVRKYNHIPNTIAFIDRVIVGSEDMQDPGIPAYIIQDADNIRAQLPQDKTIKIGTAQIPCFAKNIFDKALGGNTTKSIGDSVDFVGINPYPFWESQAYTNASSHLASTWNDFKNLAGSHMKELIITEEGWPSDGGSMGLAIASFSNANSYFAQYWNKRSEIDVPVSYYFALFDKLPALGIESHWGIFSADGAKSILDKEAGKPLDSEKKHILVNFTNVTGQDRVALHACLQDFGGSASTTSTISAINAQCYPIYGSDIVEGADYSIYNDQSKTFMVDASGNTYKSLVVYSGQQPLCYVSSKKLISFQNNGVVKIGQMPTVLSTIGECPLS